MTAVNLNSYPYFDDYDSTKGFHQIAFVPGRPIQARELTQIQTILQEQVKRVGRHFFKNGTVISPGNTYYDNKVFAVRLSNTNDADVISDTLVKSFIGETIKNATGTSAYVVHAETSTTKEPACLYVKFTSGGATGKLEFYYNDVLFVPDALGAPTSKECKVTDTLVPFSPAALVHIAEGIYYANGYFVQVLDQTIVLSSTTNLPSIQVGLNVTESIVTESDDTSLYDNSIGSPNYSSPGAHRFKISLDLVSREYNADVTFANQNLERVDFILLYNLLNGQIQYEKSKDSEYNKFESLLAKRTYEESGNYIVDDFGISAIDYRDNTRGTWTQSTAYLEGDIVTYNGKKYFSVTSGVSQSTPPTHSTGTVSDGGIDWTFITSSYFYENFGKKVSGYTGSKNPLTLEQMADDSFLIEVSNGLAYVNGYRTSIVGTSTKIANKARTFNEEFNVQISAPNPITVYATSKINGATLVPLKGLPDIQGLPLYDILDNIDGAGTSIGTCRVKSVEYVTADLFKVAIFDIRVPDISKGFAYNAVSLKSQASDATTINLARKNIPLVGTHTNGGANAVYGVLSNYDGELRVGSYITAGGNDGALVKVKSITSDVEIATQTLANVDVLMSITAGSLLSVSVVDFKVGAESSITRLPKSNVRTMVSVDNNGNINTTYKVIKQTPQPSSGTGGMSYTLAPGETFQSSGHYLCKPVSGATIIPILDSWISSDGKILTIPSGQLENTVTYRLHLKITKSGVAAAERKKVLRSKTVYIHTGTYHDSAATLKIDWVSATDALVKFNSTTPINLGYADVIRINSIRMSSSTTVWQDTLGEPAINVLDRFDFDSGQRAEIYDFGYIRTSQKCTGPLEVSFDYYEHTHGDYFTVDSYQNTPYALIPSVEIKGQVYNLRDCVDFRIRVCDSSGTNRNPAFVSVGDTMQTNDVFVFDYSYYLPRKDLLVLTSSGELQYIYGTPSIKPVFPQNTITNSMAIAKFDVSAYTYNAESDIRITLMGNRNFTMEELEKMDSRLRNVETYVELSLLEKNTANYKITDKYGLDRLKNGFFVVDFKDNTTHFTMGASDLPDYRCTILMDYLACAPNRFSTAYSLAFNATNGVSDSVGSPVDMKVYPNYLMTLNPNGVQTFNSKGIPGSTATYPKFSTKININPFNVFDYYGTAMVLPPVDNWNMTVRTSEVLYTNAGMLGSAGNGGVSSDLDLIKSQFINAWTGSEFKATDFNDAFKAGIDINLAAKFTSTSSASQFGAGITSTNNISKTYAQNSSTKQQEELAMYMRWLNIPDGTSSVSFSDASGSGGSSTTFRTTLSSAVDVNSFTLTSVSTSQKAGNNRESEFIRARSLALIVKQLMPNVVHEVNFDNSTVVKSAGQGFKLTTPLIINISHASVADMLAAQKEMKFYNEASAYTNIDKAVGPHRSFAFYSGKDYDTSINGILTKVTITGKEAYGLLAGWEKTGAQQTTLYIFPTASGDSNGILYVGHPPSDLIADFSVSTAVTVSLLSETKGSTAYQVMPITGASSLDGTIVSRPAETTTPKTTSLGNLFLLLTLKDNYFRTGGKKIGIERVSYDSTPTYAPGNYIDALGTTNVANNMSFDATLNDKSSDDSLAYCDYTATGSISEIIDSEVFQIGGTLNLTGERTTVQSDWWRGRTSEPLAQTFFIKKSSTVNSDFVMIEGISVWFATKPSDDSIHKVNLELINSENGNPMTSLVSPWATIPLNSSDVTVATAANSWAPTRKSFPAPVVLKTNTEYAIRVMAATCNLYEVWISTMGKECVNYPGQLITEQQSDGSFFTSQNASTWTPDQYSDLAFQLHVNTYSTVGQSSAMQLSAFLGSANKYSPRSYTGTSPEFLSLPLNPFGTNTTDNKIKVYHPRHMVYAAAKGKSFVKLISIPNATMDSTSTAIKTFIDGKYFKVENAKPSSYTLDLRYAYTYNTSTKVYESVDISASLASNLSAVKRRFGGDAWQIQAAGKYDMVRLNAAVLLQPPGTTVEFTKKLTYIDSNGINLESTYDHIDLQSDYQTDKQYVNFMQGELNSQGIDKTFDLGSDDSEYGMNFRCHASTSNMWNTPIIDLQSLSVSVGRSMQYPHATTDAVAGTTDYDVIFSSESCVFSGTALDGTTNVEIPSSTNHITSFTIGAMLNIVIAPTTHQITAATCLDSVATFTLASHSFFVGDTIVVTGISPAAYNGTFVITEITNANTFKVTLLSNPTAGVSYGSNNCSRTSVNNGTFVINDIDYSARKIYFTNLTAPETKSATLSLSSEYVTEVSPSSGTSQSKYITREVVLAKTSSSLHVTTAMTTPAGTGIELWYRTGNDSLINTSWIKKEISLMQTNSSRSFYDNEIEINNIAEFTRFQVKFVFTSTSHYNSAIKDLRIVALI